MTGSVSGVSYEIEPKNKYFEAIRAIAEYEIRPGNTVMFLSEVDLTEVERMRARACAAGGRKPSTPVNIRIVYDVTSLEI
jgi:hypothetical protein